ncbi:MAG: hypothetical protein AB7H93_23995 [Vicinamibacterales bacterium]
MRVRREVVGWIAALAVLTAPDLASALSCYSPPLHREVMAAGGVFEATIASRRPVNPLLFHVLEWFGLPTPNRIDRFELSLEDVEPLRGSSPSTIRTDYEYLEPGGRYVFVARQRWLGSFVVGMCVGRAIEASRASRLKAWIASLPPPAAAGVGSARRG